jgi:hypothetical protein
MAFGQIDPARLEGDALRRWYMRSPADIDRERQQAAAQRYQSFFGSSGGLDPDPSVGEELPAEGQDIDPASSTAFAPSTGDVDLGSNSGPTGSTPLDPSPVGPGRLLANAGGDGRFQLAAASSSLPAATVWNCPTCHGRLPLPLPPQLQPLQPLFRDIPSYIPSGGAPDDRKQCDIQDRNDRRICGRQPLPQDKAICHASASVRWKHCLRTGEVGTPPLDTAKRLRGR